MPTTKASLNAAKRLAQAVVDGAGGEEALAPHLNAAIGAAHRIITAGYKAAPEVVEQVVETVKFAPTRVNSRQLEANRYGKFSRKAGYTGWKKALHPIEWFDSTPERSLANLLDEAPTVTRWARIQRGELTVEWAGGRYSPDFYAAIDGDHYLFEVKADRDVATDLVQSKRAAAEQWARFVTDNGEHGQWQYLLLAESLVNDTKTVPALLQQAGVL